MITSTDLLGSIKASFDGQAGSNENVQISLLLISETPQVLRQMRMAFAKAQAVVSIAVGRLNSGTLQSTGVCVSNGLCTHTGLKAGIRVVIPTSERTIDIAIGFIFLAFSIFLRCRVLASSI